MLTFSLLSESHTIIFWCYCFLMVQNVRTVKELELYSLLHGNQGLIFDYDFLSGLQTPTNVRAQSVNDAKLLIISWDYQADVNYSTIHVKSSLKSSIGSGTSTTVVGPTQAPCNGSTCSFCVYDVERNASCYAFNKDYEVSVGIELNFDFFVSYRVGACSRNESSSCINSPWKNFTIPPGGKLKLLKQPCLIVIDRFRFWEAGTMASYF